MDGLMVALLVVAWVGLLYGWPALAMRAGAAAGRFSEAEKAPELLPRTLVPFEVLASGPAAERRYAVGFATGVSHRRRAALPIDKLLQSQFGINGIVLDAAGDGSRPRTLLAAETPTLPAAKSGAPPSQAPRCHYERGLIAGLLEAREGTPVHVHETTCRGAGAAACTFEIVPLDPRDTPPLPPLTRGRPSSASKGKASPESLPPAAPAALEVRVAQREPRE